MRKDFFFERWENFRNPMVKRNTGVDFRNMAINEEYIFTNRQAIESQKRINAVKLCTVEIEPEGRYHHL